MARRNKEKLVIIRFFVYILFLYYLFVLFKNSIFGRLFSKNFMQGLSIVPFSSGIYSKDILFSREFFSGLLGPILMFVPMGLILPLASDKTKKLWMILLIGLFFSIGIEMLQYFTKTGITSVDDLILNLVGVALGYLSYIILKEVFLYA